MTRWWRLAIVWLVTACPGAVKPGNAPLGDSVAADKRDHQADLIAELQDDILKSYERDEPPELENGMLLPAIGAARIGVGPGDVLVGAELAHAPSRWPLDVDSVTHTEPRSKRLEIHLAKDQTAAWVFDEISWRVTLCERTAIIPLRMTALYARAGDRWVPVFEHTSFGRTPTPARSGQLLPRRIATAVASRDFADELSRTLSPVLRRSIEKSPKSVSLGADASLLGVDDAAEWHGPDVVQAKLLPGVEPMKLEDRRVGVIGSSIEKSSIAYWIGNVIADLPARPGVAAGAGQFRGTFVFERRNAAWVLVQGHLSHAIEDGDLASAVFGTALISTKPLAIACDAPAATSPRAPGP